MKIIQVLGLCFLIGTKLTAAEAIADVNEVLTELEKTFSSIKTVQTGFVQTKKLKLFKHPVKLKGQVFLQTPDRLLWRVHEPIAYAFMLKGKKAFEWDQETGKTKELPFTGSPMFEQILVQIKNWFSGEFSELKKSYDLKIISKTPLVLGFTPKEDNKAKHAIQTMQVKIREDCRYIESITIFEVNGDMTTTQFQGVKLNQEIPARAWEVSPQ